MNLTDPANVVLGDVPPPRSHGIPLPDGNLHVELVSVELQAPAMPSDAVHQVVIVI